LKVLLGVPKETSMPKVPDIIPVTDLRQDAAAALRRIPATKQPLVITQRGRAAAVMLSVEAYERSEHERQILRILARGEREIAATKGHDLDEVLAEADRLLTDR
jgi:prevent-host-death family protein